MIYLFIRTRGIIEGNQFLLQTPNTKPNYADNDLEYPSCVLEKSELNSSELFLFLYGIPSKRKDREGSPIKSDLVARINLEPSDDSEKQKDYLVGLTRLVWIWLKDVKKGLIHKDNNVKWVQIPSIEKSQLGKILDDEKFFPKEYVETLLKATSNNNWTDKQKHELDRKLKAFILELTDSYPEIEQEPIGDIWWGGINNKNSCERWIKLVKNILQGNQQGKALLLNYGTPESLLTEPELSGLKNQEVGVLLAGEYSESKPQSIIHKRDFFRKQIKETLNNNLELTVVVAILIIVLSSLFSFFLGTQISQNQIDNLQQEIDNLQNQNENLQSKINEPEFLTKSDINIDDNNEVTFTFKAKVLERFGFNNISLWYQSENEYKQITGGLKKELGKQNRSMQYTFNQGGERHLKIRYEFEQGGESGQQIKGEYIDQYITVNLPE